MWGKSTNFEVAARAPLIISAPGVAAAGRTARGLVEFVDIYPTLAELCGLPRPPHLHGSSLVPLLRDPGAPGRAAAFSQFTRKGNVTGYSIRTERWRYTEWLKPDGARTAEELYDHETDAAETRNVADDARHAAHIAELRRLLHAHRTHWVAMIPSPDESEFVPLFNGRDLTGWDAAPDSWSVKDGAILSGGTRKNWLIWRGGEVADFELRLRFRFTRGNSGVQVRSADLGDWQVRGYQVEVAPQAQMGLWHQSLWTVLPRKELSLAGERMHLAADGTKTLERFADAATVQSAFRENDWNDLTVIGRGPKLVQIVNGVTFSELVDEDAQFSRRSGVIALQDHGNKCVAEFKDIRLRRLDGKP
jgi:hypothetical protein